MPTVLTTPETSNWATWLAIEPSIRKFVCARFGGIGEARQEDILSGTMELFVNRNSPGYRPYGGCVSENYIRHHRRDKYPAGECGDWGVLRFARYRRYSAGRRSRSASRGSPGPSRVCR